MRGSPTGRFVIKRDCPSQRSNGFSRTTPLLPNDVMTKIDIQYQDQFGKGRHFQTKYNEGDAYRTAANRAVSTGKRHRLVDQDGTLLDLIDP